MVAALVASMLVGSSPLEDALSSPALKGSLSGLCVTDLTGKVLFQRHGEVRLVPASNQKVLTALFALATLGPDFVPETRFWKEPTKLVVDAPGDPTVTKAQLLGVRGRLGGGKDLAVYVRQAYRPGVPPSWEWDDLPNRYAPRITSLTFDRGGFEVWCRNGELSKLEDEYRLLVRGFPEGGGAKTMYYPDKRLVVVNGPIPREDRMIEAFALPDPDATAARFLGGTIVHADSVPTRPPDFVLKGLPLVEALKFCLEKSDNGYAEHLMLMSASAKGPLGDDAYKTAAKRMAEFYEGTVGVEPGGIVPTDGSGLSRHNTVTPRALCQALAWASRQPWSRAFYECLAEPGEGTLTSRLKSRKFIGKTGTLSATVCLTGYVETVNGRRLAVSMLFNNINAPADEARAVQDRIVSLLEREAF